MITTSGTYSLVVWRQVQRRVKGTGRALALARGNPPRPEAGTWPSPDERRSTLDEASPAARRSWIRIPRRYPAPPLMALHTVAQAPLGYYSPAPRSSAQTRLQISPCHASQPPRPHAASARATGGIGRRYTGAG